MVGGRHKLLEGGGVEKEKHKAQIRWNKEGIQEI